MKREFNITGSCNPEEHYMVNIKSRLAEIKELVDSGKYFSINKGRQYGKTTTLQALKKYLSKEYIVVNLDFQFLDFDDYQSTATFVKAFSRELWRIKSCRAYMSEDIQHEIKAMKKMNEKNKYSLSDLFSVLSEWCDETKKPVVLIIDEVDNASNNQVFLDFLAQLRGYYLNRAEHATFCSVILAGVHDIRNLKQKIRPDSEHQHNSPWNIAADFNIDMSFSPEDIAGMLREYEEDHHTGMNIPKIAQMIYDSTSGYPVLVSSFCLLMDKQSAWTKDGFLKAEKVLINKKTPLFDSLINKLKENEKLRNLLHQILFNGANITYNVNNDVIDIATMYGFIINKNGNIAVFNRIFETVIYDWFLSEEITNGNKFSGGEKSQFIHNGKLNMEKVLERFVISFDDVYGSEDNKFKEEVGRRLFLLYLKPIINGTGNYYIEPRTRNERRIDVVIDYAGEQYIIELKIWRGQQYHDDGEQQLSDYLDYHHLKKGYLLTFNFNQNKETGIKYVQFGDKELIEATV
ncbi:MAG: ATP-binding protein [Oscillospiraceae bacterium]|nr:ATP-binding protein [Oscillospiraceae bacterium]